MRILKTEVEEHITECNQCKTTLAYTKYDISNEILPTSITSDYDELVLQNICCPICGHKFTVGRFERNT